MDYFVDIHIRQNKNKNIPQTMNLILSKLHIALVTLNSNTIGISFPMIHKNLGDMLRIHSSYDNLIKLQSLNWHDGLHNYCHVSIVNKIPENVNTYKKFSRIKPIRNNAKLRNAIKKFNMSDKDILDYKLKMAREILPNPYFTIKSSSNGNYYKRFIKIEQSEKLKNGEFDTFGMSNDANVPFF